MLYVFKNNEEILDAYDKSAKSAAESISTIDKAKKMIEEIFNISDNQQKSNLAMLFLLSQGFSTGKITELGSFDEGNVNNAKYGNISYLAGVKVVEQKENYNAFMKSMNIDVLSNDTLLIDNANNKSLHTLIMNCFDAFIKDVNTYQSAINDLDSFNKNIGRLLPWAGLCDLLRINLAISFTDSKKLKDEKTAFADGLDKAISEKYGNGMSLRHMMAFLTTIKSVDGYLRSSGFETPEKYEKTVKENNPEKMKDMENAVYHSMRLIRNVNSSVAAKIMKGDITEYFSVSTALAGAVEMYDARDNNRMFGDNHLQDLPEFDDRTGAIRMAEMRYLAGDQSSVIFSNIAAADKLKLSESDDKTDSFVDEASHKIYFNADILKEKVRSYAKDPAGLKEKIKNNKEGLDHYDVALYLSDLNPAYTEKRRYLTRAFMAGSPKLHFEKFPDELKTVLTAYVKQRYNAQPEDYLSGSLKFQGECRYVFQNAKKALNSLNSLNPQNVDIENIQIMPAKLHREKIDYMINSLDGYNVTIASSKEFKKFAKALQALNDIADPDLNSDTYPLGDEVQYLENLKKLKDTAEKYINEKNKDGKKERSSDSGQVRLNVAKMALTFAEESIKGMGEMKEAMKEKFGQLAFEKRMLGAHQKYAARLETKSKKAPAAENLKQQEPRQTIM